MRNVVEFKPTFYQSLSDKVKQARILDKHLKKLTKSLNGLKKDIKEEMGDNEFVYDESGLELCTYLWVNASKFDRKTFDLEHPTIYSQYLLSAPQRKFNFK